MTGPEKYCKEVILLKRWAVFGNEDIDKFIVENLEPIDEKIINLRYKKIKSWLRIGVDVHMSDRQLYRRHNKILEKLYLWNKDKSKQSA